MNYKEELISFKNGVKLVFVKTPGFNRAKFKVSFAVGAEDEATPAGLAHLVEHGIFKGTKNLTQDEISARFNCLSAEPDASTSSEFTTFKATFPKRNLESVVDLYAEIIFNSDFKTAEIEKEKQVILEEIKMYEDNPEQLAFDKFVKSIYEGVGIGNLLAGEKSLLKKVKPLQMKEFRDTHYSPQNTYIYVVGDFRKEDVVQIVENKFLSQFKNGEYETKVWSRNCSNKRRVIETIKPIAQANVVMGFNTLPYENMDRVKLNIISYILGGSMNSRLFKKVRNELGLCYSIYSFDINYKNNGFLAISFQSAVDTANLTINSVMEEIKKILDEGVTDEEFSTAKQMAIDKFLINQDYPSASLSYLAYTGKLLDNNALYKLLLGLSKNECEEVFRDCIKLDEVNISYVGKRIKL